MTNEERRRALNKARAEAIKHATWAEEAYGRSAEDGPEAILACMWAAVANAMKDGDPLHDGPSGSPTAMEFELPGGTEVR